MTGFLLLSATVASCYLVIANALRGEYPSFCISVLLAVVAGTVCGFWA